MNQSPTYDPLRRADVLRMTPAEQAIRLATLSVEQMEAHPLLTEAVVLLSQAQAKVADFVDGIHASDCATHNAPAMEPGPCDCGAHEMDNAI